MYSAFLSVVPICAPIVMPGSCNPKNSNVDIIPNHKSNSNLSKEKLPVVPGYYNRSIHINEEECISNNEDYQSKNRSPAKSNMKSKNYISGDHISSREYEYTNKGIEDKEIADINKSNKSGSSSDNSKKRLNKSSKESNKSKDNKELTETVKALMIQNETLRSALDTKLNDIQNKVNEIIADKERKSVGETTYNPGYIMRKDSQLVNIASPENEVSLQFFDMFSERQSDATIPNIATSNRNRLNTEYKVVKPMMMKSQISGDNVRFDVLESDSTANITDKNPKKKKKKNPKKTKKINEIDFTAMLDDIQTEIERKIGIGSYNTLMVGEKKDTVKGRNRKTLYQHDKKIPNEETKDYENINK